MSFCSHPGPLTPCCSLALGSLRKKTSLPHPSSRSVLRVVGDSAALPPVLQFLCRYLHFLSLFSLHWICKVQALASRCRYPRSHQPEAGTVGWMRGLMVNLAGGGRLSVELGSTTALHLGLYPQINQAMNGMLRGQSCERPAVRHRGCSQRSPGRPGSCGSRTACAQELPSCGEADILSCIMGGCSGFGPALDRGAATALAVTWELVSRSVLLDCSWVWWPKKGKQKALSPLEECLRGLAWLKEKLILFKAGCAARGGSNPDLWQLRIGGSGSGRLSAGETWAGTAASVPEPEPAHSLV